MGVERWSDVGFHRKSSLRYRFEGAMNKGHSEYLHWMIEKVRRLHQVHLKEEKIPKGQEDEVARIPVVLPHMDSVGQPQ